MWRLLTIVFLRCCAATPESDEASLIQGSVNGAPRQLYRSDAGGQKDHCACLNFKQVYREGYANCGDGWEDSSEEWACEWFGKGVINAIGVVGTGRNFKKASHNYCVNVNRSNGENPVTEPTKTWCYVPWSCQQLNGGERVSQYASWKYCGESDKSLSDLVPQDLANFTFRKRLDPQGVFMMAYQWAGPGKGEKGFDTMDLDYDTPYVGASTKHDILNVRYRDQLWEIDDNIKCVYGAVCDEPFNRALRRDKLVWRTHPRVRAKKVPAPASE